MLTPLDIENKTFGKGMRGYDIEEVEEFLNQILIDYEKMYKDNISLKDRMTTLTDAVNHYKSMEETMQNAILIAQKTGEEIKKSSQEQSETIIQDARSKSTQMIYEANAQIEQKIQRYNSIQNEFNVYRIKMLSVLKAQQDMLNSVSENDTITRKEELYNESRLFQEPAVTSNGVPDESQFASERTQNTSKLGNETNL